MKTMKKKKIIRYNTIKMQKAVNQIYWVKSWLRFRLGSFAKNVNRDRISLFAFYARRKMERRLNVKKDGKENSYSYSAYM